MISQHYQTGEPLPDAMIDALIASKDFDEGSFMSRQVMLAKLSLYLYKDGQNKDPMQVNKEIYDSAPREVAYNPDLHFVCAFGHLTAYGSKVYKGIRGLKSWRWTSSITRSPWEASSTPSWGSAMSPKSSARAAAATPTS